MPSEKSSYLKSLLIQKILPPPGGERWYFNLTLGLPTKEVLSEAYLRAFRLWFSANFL